MAADCVFSWRPWVSHEECVLLTEPSSNMMNPIWDESKQPRVSHHHHSDTATKVKMQIEQHPQGKYDMKVSSRRPHWFGRWKNRLELFSPLSWRFPDARILCCCRSILPLLAFFVFDSTRRATRRIRFWPWAWYGQADIVAPSMLEYYVLLAPASVEVGVVNKEMKT